MRSSPAAANGEISYSNQPDKSRVDWKEHANYTCDEGFVLAGNMTRSCGYSRTDGSLGQWDLIASPAVLVSVDPKRRPRANSHISPEQLKKLR